MRGKRLAWAMMMMACAGSVAVAPPLQARTAPAETLTIDKQRIDAALQKMVADGRAAGTSALIWQDGREVYFGSAGMADRAANRPMRRDTIAQIYSMTKPVTGVALMQLWEAGKFRLDDPLAKYLPEYADMRVYAGKDAAGQPRYVAAERPIAVRDILRHTAGFVYGADRRPRTRPMSPPTRSRSPSRLPNRAAGLRACPCCSSRVRSGNIASRSMCRPRSSRNFRASRSHPMCASISSSR